MNNQPLFRSEVLRQERQRHQQPVRQADDHVEERAPKKRSRGSRMGRFFKRHWLITLLMVSLLAATGFLAYGYIDTRNELTRLSKAKNANASSGEVERDRLVAEIGAYMQLPNEAPTLATVSDADKLKSQEFFKNAQNGDKVLIFPEAGRALLYRPSAHKVIEYAKVNLGGASQVDQQDTP